jgi:DNA polymerase III subunit epsilon
MKILFFDCETNGLPIKYNGSYTDVDNWPRVIQLAYVLTDEHANVLKERSFLIKPDGWVVPTEKFWIENGHSTERCEEEGWPIVEVLDDFMSAKQEADLLVAHNLNFDHRIVWAEFIRAGMEPRSGMLKICTMQSSTTYCKLPQANGRGGFKWPKLEELHRSLFACDFDGAHDAMADIQATVKCFFTLVTLGVIKLPVLQLPDPTDAFV